MILKAKVLELKEGVAKKSGKPYTICNIHIDAKVDVFPAFGQKLKVGDSIFVSCDKLTHEVAV